MKLINKLTLILFAGMMISCGNSNESKVVKTTPIAVQVKEAKMNMDGSTITVSGTIQGVNKADLSTRMMGAVKQINIKLGDEVKKGQLLLVIDDADISAQLAQAKANLITAETNYKNTLTNYNRFKNLFEKNSATQKEFDDISTQLKMSEAQVTMAKEAVNRMNAQFQYTNIVAPFNGTIAAKTVKIGDLAKPGMPLVSIEGTKEFEVIGMVPETYISAIQKTNSVQVSIPSLNKEIKAEIKEFSGSATNTAGQYQITVRLPKSAENLLAGMYAQIQISIDSNSAEKNAIQIDKKALIQTGQLTGVYTVSESGTAILRWVQTGNEFGEQVEILSGLTQNEKYIVFAEGKLFNGAQITLN